jgi:hypothetical protein
MIRRRFAVAALGAAIGSPAWGALVTAYVSVDAGGATDFVSVSDSLSTGVITKAVTDNAGGGLQTASTSAYADIGVMGGRVQGSTNVILVAGQGFNDLNWYTDFQVTGAPGTQVAYLMSAALDGYTFGAGQNYSGRVTSTAYVWGSLLADYFFDLLVNPGPFSVLTSQIFIFDVGTTIRLSSRMTVMGRADQVAVVDVNAFSTSRFYVDVLTPGGGYTTDAGIQFPALTSIPEPATWGLCLIAAGLVQCGRRRRGRSARTR